MNGLTFVCSSTIKRTLNPMGGKRVAGKNKKSPSRLDSPSPPLNPCTLGMYRSHS